MPPCLVQQKITAFSPENFAFNLGGPEPDNMCPNGFPARLANINQLPSLEGQGVAMVLFNYEPCAINLPHEHPRATEVS